MNHMKLKIIPSDPEAYSLLLWNNYILKYTDKYSVKVNHQFSKSRSLFLVLFCFALFAVF